MKVGMTTWFNLVQKTIEKNKNRGRDDRMVQFSIQNRKKIEVRMTEWFNLVYKTIEKNINRGGE